MPLPMGPESFARVLAAFTGCFTVPTSRPVCHLVAGWVHGVGRHTVTGVAGAAGTGAAGTGVIGWRPIRACHACHRFCTRATWEADALGQVAVPLARRVLPAGGALILLVDDSRARQEGKAIALGALGSMHHDPLLSTALRPCRRFGHV